MSSIGSVIHRVPILRILVPFILGIIAEYLGIDYKLSPLLLLLGGMTLVLYYLIKSLKNKYRYRWTFGTAIGILMFGFGLFISHEALNKESIESGVYLAKVIKTPKEGENSIKCVANLSKEVEKRKKDPTEKKKPLPKVLLYLNKTEKAQDINKGDLLAVKIEKEKEIKADNPGQYDAKKEENANASFYVNDQNWEKVSEEVEWSMGEIAQNTQNQLVEILKKKQKTMKRN